MYEIALIDADSLIFHCALGNKDNPPTLESAIADFESRIYKMVQAAGCNKYILLMSDKKVFRHFITKSTKMYKSNRKSSVFPPVYIGLKAYMRQKPAFQCQNYEADDAVGLFQYYINKYNLGKSSICSPDKDVLNQIVGVNYNYGKELIVNTTKEDSENFIITQLMMGDPSDGIAGIPKVGIKTAEKFLEHFKDLSFTDKLHKVLEMYMEKFGYRRGILNFTETFRLIYLLKTEEDQQLELGFTYSEEEFKKILEGDELSEGYLLSLELDEW